MDLEKILNEHEKFQKQIKQWRKRSYNDAVISCIAEIVEFNEEIGYYAHDTWKKKEYSREKMLEELVDVLFFFFELLEIKKVSKKVIAKLSKAIKDKYFFDEVLSMDNNLFLQLILKLIFLEYEEFLKIFFKIAKIYNVKLDEVEEVFYKKLEKNYKRISSEWR